MESLQLINEYSRNPDTNTGRLSTRALPVMNGRSFQWTTNSASITLVANSSLSSRASFALFSEYVLEIVPLLKAWSRLTAGSAVPAAAEILR